MTEIGEFSFDADKNAHLTRERGIGFEEIILLIAEGHLLDVIDHLNRSKYPNQRIYIVDVDGYAFMVPYERRDGVIFLKTIFPSRKATRDYLDEKGGKP